MNIKDLNTDILSTLFCAAAEMIDDSGEDSFFYSAHENSAVAAVFDGCGGIGSRRYMNYSGKTGAFIGARAACGGVERWFNTSGKPRELKEYIKRALDKCKKFGDSEGRLTGSLGKAFPTTAAIVYTRYDKAFLDITCMWAGDSRCCMLDSDGLHQISRDDISGGDALSNISGDGVLTNVICADSDFEIHMRNIKYERPCILFSATDGCFGYLDTPMEFEKIILDTLTDAASIADWNAALSKKTGEYAGDDYTMCVSAFGYRSFECMKDEFAKRRNKFYSEYQNSSDSKEESWEKYKIEYYKYS